MTGPLGLPGAQFHDVQDAARQRLQHRIEALQSAVRWHGIAIILLSLAVMGLAGIIGYQAIRSQPIKVACAQPVPEGWHRTEYVEVDGRVLLECAR